MTSHPNAAGQQQPHLQRAHDPRQPAANNPFAGRTAFRLLRRYGPPATITVDQLVATRMQAMAAITVSWPSSARLNIVLTSSFQGKGSGEEEAEAFYARGAAPSADSLLPNGTAAAAISASSRVPVECAVI